MAKMQLRLAPQTRMMKICGINIIGNPETNTIIGLSEDGMLLVQKIQACDTIDSSSINKDQIMLINELSANGFFTIADHSFCVQSAYLHVTSHCNLQCPGCYSYEADRNAVCDLTLNELKSVLDNLVNAGLTHLVISGGEPFSREDLGKFLAYAKTISQIQYIECITNGTASLDTYRDAVRYLDKLTFSLDSANAESAIIRPAAIFSAIVDKLILLQAENNPISIVFTIHHGNVAHISDLVSLANALNVEYRFSILSVESFHDIKTPLMLTPEDYQTFHNFIMSHQGNVSVEDSAVGNEVGCIVSCGAGKTMTSIASDGSIYPCHMFVGKEQFVMGNALHDNVKEIINNSQCNLFHELNVDCVERCRDCHIRYICGGGCRFRAYAESGNISGSDPMCKIYMDNKESCISRLMALST